MPKQILLFIAFLLVSLEATAAVSQLEVSSLLSKARNSGSIRIIVGLKQESLLANTNQISLAQSGLETRFKNNNMAKIKYFTSIPYMAMEVDTATLERLSIDPNITSIEEDKISDPTLGESIPFIRANIVHPMGYDGTGWAIAILDSGVRKTHEFLDSGKIISEACYSSNNSARNVTTVCPNGQESQVGSGAGVNCNTNISGCSHGTHVAGIAAGTGGAPGTGVAPGANIIAVQVFSKFNNASDCVNKPTPCARTYTSDQILGLERVYALRNSLSIAAVNMSLGDGENHTSYCDSDARKAIIDQLRNVGIATIISSGNDSLDGGVGAPGCISSAITVGATLNNSDFVWHKSNHASMIDLMAPGAAISSSIADTNNSYSSYSGTSMAAPHVAGAFAVMRDKNSAWSVSQIETLLENTGSDVSRLGLIKPRINLLAAVDDNYEENNTLAAAYDLSNHQQTWLYEINGLGVQNNEDWYKIHLDSNSSVFSIDLRFTHSEGDLDLAVYDSNGQHLISSNSASNNEFIFLSASPNADYFLKIHHGNNGSPYNLRWNTSFIDNYEPNDSLATAYDLSTNERTWLDNIDGKATQHNEDWYKIHIDANSSNLHATLVFSHLEGDIDLELFDSNGTSLAKSESVSDNESLDFSVSPSTDYFLKVYYQNHGNTYDLWWDDVPNNIILGDCTEDGISIDIHDVVCTTNQALSPPPTVSDGADCDENNVINQDDVICTINKALE